MSTNLEQIYSEALASLQQVNSEQDLESWYRQMLGRKGQVYLMTRQIGQIDPQERPAFGKRLNEVKQSLQSAYDQRREEIQTAEMVASFSASAIDVTLPGRVPRQGGLHVITQTLREIYRIFGDMGFQIYRSPDVETDEEALVEIRKFLSYMPSHNSETPPVADVPAGSDEAAANIPQILPDSRKRGYDVRKIINCVVDQVSFF